MNNFHPIRYTIIHVIFMTQENFQIQEFDILRIEPLVLDHFQLHVNQLKVLFLDIVRVIEISIPSGLYHVQGTLNSIFYKETLDFLTILLPESNAIVLFLDPSPEIDSTSESIIHHIGLHQTHVADLHSNLEGSSLF